MDLNPPTAKELELSVFGRGYGEAICVHLGEGEWAVVDSCINPHTRHPAALSYLEALGLPSHDVVRLIVATHWDDDHIRGLSAIVRDCPNARVACSAALRRQEIIAFVIDQEAAQGVLGSGVDEFRKILRLCRDRSTQILWAKANLPLYPLPPGDTPRVVALSPSEDAFERSIESLIEAATAARSTLPRRYRAPEGPNGASVAISVRNANLAMLLGADLVTSTNEEAGWDAVVKYSKPSIQASAVKVPHHGSPGAHHEGMWRVLAEAGALAVLTPWARGANFLPTMEDLDRLRSVAGRLYLTAVPSLGRVRKDRDLERMIRRLHGDQISELRGWGHVRLRRGLEEPEWRVALAGDARAVTE
jgi:hypothetical protein